MQEGQRHDDEQASCCIKYSVTHRLPEDGITKQPLVIPYSEPFRRAESRPFKEAEGECKQSGKQKEDGKQNIEGRNKKYGADVSHRNDFLLDFSGKDDCTAAVVI